MLKIDQYDANQALLQRSLLQSAIALCFSEKAQDDKVGKMLERMTDFDPDGMQQEKMQSKEELQEILKSKYPHLVH